MLVYFFLNIMLYLGKFIFFCNCVLVEIKEGEYIRKECIVFFVMLSSCNVLIYLYLGMVYMYMYMFYMFMCI